MATTTIGDMADLFCCTTDDITDAVDGNDDLDMIVGGQIGGGGGHFGFDTEDEYRVEWVGE